MTTATVHTVPMSHVEPRRWRSRLGFVLSCVLIVLGGFALHQVRDAAHDPPAPPTPVQGDVWTWRTW